MNLSKIKKQLILKEIDMEEEKNSYADCKLYPKALFENFDRINIIEQFLFVKELLVENGGWREDPDCNPAIATAVEILESLHEQITADPRAVRALNNVVRLGDDPKWDKRDDKYPMPERKPKPKPSALRGMKP